MPKLTMTAAGARNAVLDEHCDFETLSTQIDGHDRWAILKSTILHHFPTGNHYIANYRVGATEHQDEGPYEYDEYVDFIQVEAIEVTVRQWRNVED